jgi:RIO-like serine/threonine protein kinase
MRTITEELNDLKTILDALEKLNRMHDFIGKDEIDSRLRWSAKNTADKINHLSNLNG